MIKSIAQIKALIRATAPSDRLDVIREVYVLSLNAKAKSFASKYRKLFYFQLRKKSREKKARFSEQGLVND